MLTADELCDICEASPSQRQAWAKDGDLRQRRGFEELDAAELAACVAIRDAVGPKRGKAAWKELRPVLQELLIQGASGVWLVVEYRGVESHDLVTTPKDLARRVANGRPVVVIDLRSPVELARKAYRDAVGNKRGDLSAEVRRIRSRG